MKYPVKIPLSPDPIVRKADILGYVAEWVKRYGNPSNPSEKVHLICLMYLLFVSENSEVEITEDVITKAMDWAELEDNLDLWGVLFDECIF